LCELLL